LLLHHDNWPAHTSLKTTEFVTNNNMVIVPHPPYSLDVGPCDFTLFPELNMKLKGWHFETVSTWQHWGKWLPWCFWNVEKNMGSLYTFPRRLFWMRWQPKLGKLSQHFFFDLVRELSDTPRIHIVCPHYMAVLDTLWLSTWPQYNFMSHTFLWNVLFTLLKCLKCTLNF
jgi:hypothetical protein